MMTALPSRMAMCWPVSAWSWVAKSRVRRCLLIRDSYYPGPEVAEFGVWVREQLVDDGEHRVAASDDRLLLAATLAHGLAGGLVGLRAELRPRHQMRGGRESGHVDPGLGDQPTMSARRVACREIKADRVLDQRVECGDLGADPVAVVEHHLQNRRVVVGEEIRSTSSNWSVFFRAPLLASRPASADPALRRSGRASSPVRIRRAGPRASTRS